MTTQIKLHERIEGMHEEMLMSEGIVKGSFGSFIAQLASGENYMEEFHELLREADSIIVGDSDADGPPQIADIFDGPTEVTEAKIRQTSATVAACEDLSTDILGWVKNHKGTDVFVIHW